MIRSMHLPVDGGGADVDGQAEAAALVVAGLHVDQEVAPAGTHRPDEGGRDPEVLLPQHPPQLAEHRRPTTMRSSYWLCSPWITRLASAMLSTGEGRGEFQEEFFHRRLQQPPGAVPPASGAAGCGGAAAGTRSVSPPLSYAGAARDLHGQVACDYRRQAWPCPPSPSAALSFSLIPPVTVPALISTRHLPQTPAPPQEALMCSPASWAALSRVPVGRSTVHSGGQEGDFDGRRLRRFDHSRAWMRSSRGLRFSVQGSRPEKMRERTHCFSLNPEP